MRRSDGRSSRWETSRMPGTLELRVKRVYDTPVPADGWRVLVDRLWPRGLSRERAQVDFWAKDLAPSTELRKWFAHDASRFDQFCERYAAELLASSDAVRSFSRSAAGRTVTLLYATRSESCNHALVLRDFLATLSSR